MPKTVLRRQDSLATRVAERRRKPLRVLTCGVAESGVVRVSPAVAIGRAVWAAHDVPGLVSSRAHACHVCHGPRAWHTWHAWARGEIYGAGVRSMLAIDPCLV